MQRSSSVDDGPLSTSQGPSPSCIGPYQYGCLRAFSIRPPAALSTSRSLHGGVAIPRWRCLSWGFASDRIVVVVGGDWKILAATHVLILVPWLLFVSVSATSRAQSVVLSLFIVATLISLWRTAFTDPGVVPAQPPAANADVKAVVREYLALPSRPDRIVVERRWCVLCNLYRPARCVHCRFCNVCMLRRDHHCPWTGLCCGLRNYRFYVSFLAHVVLAALLLTFFTVVNLRRRFVSLRASHAAAPAPTQSHGGGSGGGADASWSLFGQAVVETKFVEILLCVYALCGCVLVGSLLRYHVYLIGAERTTTEDAKLLAGGASSTTTLGGASANETSPFHRGSWLANAKALLWDAVPPSLLCATASPEGQRRLAEVLRVEEIKEEAAAPQRPSAFDPFVSGPDADDDRRSADGAVMVRIDSLANLVHSVGDVVESDEGRRVHDARISANSVRCVHHDNNHPMTSQERHDEAGAHEVELESGHRL